MEEKVPDYLLKYSSQESPWKIIQLQLDYCEEFVSDLIIADIDYASFGKYFSEDEISTSKGRIKVEPTNLIHLDEILEPELFLSAWQEFKDGLVAVKPSLTNKQLTPELLIDWGVLQRNFGIIQQAYFAQCKVGKIASAEKRIAQHKKKKPQSIWASAYIKHKMDKENLSANAACAHLESKITDIVESGKDCFGFPISWFAEMLKKRPAKTARGQETVLASPYTSSKLIRSKDCATFRFNVSQYYSKPHLYPPLEIHYPT